MVSEREWEQRTVHVCETNREKDVETETMQRAAYMT